MKHIHRGWLKPGEEIPQPIGVVLGGNLRQSSKPSSKLPRQDDRPDEKDK
jgi:hypothetical protein